MVGGSGTGWHLQLEVPHGCRGPHASRMTAAQLMLLTELQGLRVGIARSDGTRLDDCALLGVLDGGRAVWVDVNGREMLLSFADIRDVWEVRP